MKKNNAHTAKVYTTLDAYQAGFLTLKKHAPDFVDQQGKIVFVFIQTTELMRDLTDYNAGAVVEASRFAFAIKTLKSQIHSMRKNKEDYYAKEKSPQ